ncbi:MAG: 4Fe-4S dicluster domain-containing protein [Bdellovibrionota bacterium]|nr:MAG: 4Fe-4S dicluster domain-containing protein [Bdellovibrionota bacterium]
MSNEVSTEKKGIAAETHISRRKFLQILGQTTVVGAAAGCADGAKEHLIPFVKGEVDQVPGVAVWYRSTCQECSAGCGIQVRTREGRAVKVEGNRDHPINGGGVCALGQASLQALYDPDRVRQPLKVAERGTSTTGESILRHETMSWSEGLQKLAERLKDNGKKKILITGEVSGATAELIAEFAKSQSVEHIVWDPLQPVATAQASELVYGVYGVPRYDFGKAEVVLNFGADIFETYVSPVEYARAWAKNRKLGTPSRIIHVEPRLSLTAGNADSWLNVSPGSELWLAKYLLAEMVRRGKGHGLRESILDGIRSHCASATMDRVVQECGIAKERITLLAQYLVEAKSSLVLSGGASSASTESLALAVATALLNLVLGNVGDTVHLDAMRKPQSSLAKIRKAVEEMDAGKVGTVIVWGTNPAYSLPAALKFHYAVKKVGLVVSCNSALDETAALADIILPANVALESWGDSRPVAGVYSLVQPVMQPLYDTRSFGDILLEAMGGAVSGGAKDFQGYLQESWKKIHQASGSADSFERFWSACVEHGGYFPQLGTTDRARVNVSDSALGLLDRGVHFTVGKESGTELVLLPFPSVKSFDGRAANRPWLQELPDPIVQSVWGGWAEMHPDKAAKLGIAYGDVVQLRNDYGELNLPVYLSAQVHPDVVAVPMGYGHTAMGRYAKEAQAGNVMALLSPELGNSDAAVLLNSTVLVQRGRGRETPIVQQEMHDQHDREIARSVRVPALGAAALGGLHSNGGHGHGAHGGGGGEGGHGGHHEPKQMYEQREHPVYKWGMAVDLAACTGCSACVVACYAENNIPVVGVAQAKRRRVMSWLRIERYTDGSAEELEVSFLPMMCQHCNNAPCEPVCPVYATYHNEEGLNAMVYNRCVGTRYCLNNCSYKVRRFNWFEYDVPEPVQWQFNPDVVKRGVGVMEKCTFCLQRINEAKDHAKDEGRLVADGEVQPACVQSCPTEALVFGNLNDPHSRVSELSHSPRAYKVLDHHINTQPSVIYLERVRCEV